jgi:hypothetical protein
MQSLMIIFFARKPERLHFLYHDISIAYFNNAVTHQQGAGIYTENYFSWFMQTGSIFTDQSNRLNRHEDFPTQNTPFRFWILNFEFAFPQESFRKSKLLVQRAYSA